MIRVVLPSHLRMHAGIDGEVTLAVEGAVTQRSVMDALEARYPVLREPFAITARSGGVRSCASSPARPTSRWSRRTNRCRIPSRKARNRC